MTNEEIAYAAGFFDGEGYIAIRNETRVGKTGRHIQLVVRQKDDRILWYLRDLFGVGYVKHYKNNEPSWEVKGKAAIEVVKLLRPYSKAQKAEQIDRALKAYEEGTETPRIREISPPETPRRLRGKRSKWIPQSALRRCRGRRQKDCPEISGEWFEHPPVSEDSQGAGLSIEEGQGDISD